MTNRALLNPYLLNILQIFIFLIPVGAISIRHWSNSFMLVMLFISFYAWLRQKKLFFEGVSKDEKIFASFLLFFFVVLLLDIWYHTNNVDVNRNIENGIRFLFIIPIYLLLRQIKNIQIYFIWGLIIGVIFTGIYAFIDVKTMIERGYFEIIVGPLITTYMFIIILAIEDLKLTFFYKIAVIAVVVVCVLWTIYVVENRASYLVFVVSFVLCVFMLFKLKNALLLALVGFIFMFSIYNFIPVVNERARAAIENTKKYIKSDDINDEVRITSTGTRLEMWRITPYFLQDSIVMGSGYGTYERRAKELVEAGVIQEYIGNHFRPHNLFIEQLQFKGLLGLFAILLLVFYPLYIFVRDIRISVMTSRLGIVLQTSVVVQSLTESLVYRGSYLITYFFILSVIMIWHERKKTKDYFNE
jgi:O-antigen ligase